MNGQIMTNLGVYGLIFMLRNPSLVLIYNLLTSILRYL
jgi:hypothetical protein